MAEEDERLSVPTGFELSEEEQTLVDSQKPKASLRFETHLEYTGIEDVLATYADAALVARTEKEYSIYFFQTPVPASAFNKEKTEAPARARCVARIVFSPKLMEELFRAMVQNVRDLQAEKGEE